MDSYSEKFSSIYHEHHKSKMKKLSIGTEGFFDFFKKKKKEQEKEKTIEDIVKLFTQQLSVTEKAIQESSKEEWVIRSTLLGKVSNSSELIKSVKGQVAFLKDLEKAQRRVVEAIYACNAYTKAWSKDYGNEKLVYGGYDKLLGYKVTYKNFPSLTTYNKENGAISLTDKFDTFFVRMSHADTEYTSKYFEDISEVLGRYGSIPGIHADFKFSRSLVAEVKLSKQEFISFMKELEEINSKLLVLYKDYINFETSKLYDAVEESARIYGNLVDRDDEDLMSLLQGAQELQDSYEDGTYTGFCESVVDAYVKYIHSFLNEQSKP